ncbi:anaphase promoting complex subunit 10 [Trypanosoma theileri]|uniref:Anaphase promoting complex subunit 10 n=1 Tax=Trypanosoma theileri TaxID=67003 RepID=A0A1X0P6H6_9TRYP|nr:anaphase promoting complex subunit 10 [Trypanosoma theileri]ORC92431.1 anaphase promoting complex subunit 10 [Trypanosoma theileri]
MEHPPVRGEEVDERLEPDNNENINSGDSETPSVIDDDELTAREKHQALIALHDAVWTVSSAKHGNGVTCLLEASHDTYWQSDGVLPHTILIEFARLTPVVAVALYLDYVQDESYTPRKLRIQAGTHNGDIADVAHATVDDPKGWVLLKMYVEPETLEPWDIGIIRPAGEERGVDNNNNNSRGMWSTTATRGIGRGVDVSSAASPPMVSGVMDHDDYAEFIVDAVWCTQLRIVLEENRQNGRDCHVRGVRVLGPVHQSVFTTASFTQDLMLR